MKIKVGENYEITSDSLNVILNQRYSKKVEEGANPEFGHKTIGFFPNLEIACKHLLDKELKESEVENLEELIRLIRKTKDEIRDTVIEFQNVCLVTGKASDENIKVLGGQVALSEQGAKKLIDEILEKVEEKGWLD